MAKRKARRKSSSRRRRRKRRSSGPSLSSGDNDNSSSSTITIPQHHTTRYMSTMIGISVVVGLVILYLILSNMRGTHNGETLLDSGVRYATGGSPPLSWTQIFLYIFLTIAVMTGTVMFFGGFGGNPSNIIEATTKGKVIETIGINLSNTPPPQTSSSRSLKKILNIGETITQKNTPKKTSFKQIEGLQIKGLADLLKNTHLKKGKARTPSAVLRAEASKLALEEENAKVNQFTPKKLIETYNSSTFGNWSLDADKVEGVLYSTSNSINEMAAIIKIDPSKMNQILADYIIAFGMIYKIEIGEKGVDKNHDIQIMFFKGGIADGIAELQKRMENIDRTSPDYLVLKYQKKILNKLSELAE